MNESCLKVRGIAYEYTVYEVFNKSNPRENEKEYMLVVFYLGAAVYFGAQEGLVGYSLVIHYKS